VATRGMLRVVLGRYLGAGPRALRFVLGPKGKPALPGEEGRVALEFNVSHTRGLALIAAATNREVGVDIEQSRPVPDMDGIVERFFAPGERAAFRSLPHAHRQVAFLRAWTLKEAYLKARGDGLTHALDRFAVTVDPDQPACLLAIDGDQREASNWSLASFTPAEGYTAAVAAPGHGWRVQVREWPSRHAGIER